MSTTTAPRPRRAHALVHRWPALLGLAAAALILLTGGGGDTAATTVLVAALCYLAAAATDRPWVAWAAIPVATVVIVAGALLGAAPWVSLGVVGAAVALAGVLLGASRATLGAQAAALLGYGGLAVLGLFLPASTGAVLAGAVLVLHAVWDVVHLRRGRVVPGSLAEFCVFLDVPVGLTVIGLALAAG